MKVIRIKKTAFCEGYLHEKRYYPRGGVERKKLHQGDLVEFVEEWTNLYGAYTRVCKDGETYDMLPENCEHLNQNSDD